MIWFRRIIAIPLTLVFIILFIALMVVHRTNATVGDPDFYIGRLRQADIYNFAYHEILPAALEELEIDDDGSDFPIDVALLKSRVPAMVEDALPPEWLQAQLEQSIDEIVPYVVGDTDEFTITIPLKDRVEAVVGAVKDTLHDDEFFNDLYEQGIDFAIDKYTEMEEDLPSFLALSDAEVASTLRTILPQDWIREQIDTALDEVLPYFISEEEHFLLKLDISERLDALEDVLTDIMMKPEAHDYFTDNLIVSYIQDNTQAVINLSIGVSFTESEVIAAVQQVLTLDWYRAQVTDIVGQAFAYLKGERETISIVIPVAELKPSTIDVLTGLADQKLEVVFNLLPLATPEQEAALLANPPVGIFPPYRPPGMSYTELKALVSIDVEDVTAASVDEWMPDDFTFSDADIRGSFADEGEKDVLTQARDLVRDGFTFTDADLRENFGDDFGNIEDAREWMASDFVFTEADLQELITDDAANDADDWQSYQDIRSIIGTARSWLWPAWLIPVLLLVGIGFLGGRNWRSRVLWGASVLAIASLIVVIAIGPVFSALAQPRIDDALAEAVSGTEGVQALAAAKGVAIAQDAIDSFIGGIYIWAIVLLVLSLVAIAAVIFWHFWRRRSVLKQEETPPSNLPPPEEPQDLPDAPTD
jgi:hypothetical protein